MTQGTRDREGTRWTFIVSLTQDESSGMRGVVELVRTGRKERFRDLHALGTVIAEMLRPWSAKGGES